MSKEQASSPDVLIAIEKQLKLITAAIDRQTDAIAFHNLKDNVLEFHYEGQPIRLYLPQGDYDYIQNAIMRSRTFYEETKLRAIRKTFDLRGKTVLDVGANIGNHTLYFASVCQAAKCISFEPNPHPAAILRRNVELNALHNVEFRQCAISDLPGALSFGRYSAKNIGATSYEDDITGAIPAHPVDDLINEAVHFIKIDVEGMAIRVLHGARRTLSTCRPGLMIELFPAEFQEANSFLEDSGYKKIASLGASNYLYGPA